MLSLASFQDSFFNTVSSLILSPRLCLVSFPYCLQPHSQMVFSLFPILPPASFPNGLQPLSHTVSSLMLSLASFLDYFQHTISDHIPILHVFPVSFLDYMYFQPHSIPVFRLIWKLFNFWLNAMLQSQIWQWVWHVNKTTCMSSLVKMFICSCSDLNLDTQLELMRSREYYEYTFRSMPEYKDGRYKGPWKNAKPHGR